jgi:general secretion pathway protein J
MRNSSRIDIAVKQDPFPTNRKKRGTQIRQDDDLKNTLRPAPYAVPASVRQLLNGKNRNRTAGDQRPASNIGFTLIEILVAILILGVVVTTILASFNMVFSTTEALESSNLYYEMGKNCLNRMILDLKAIHVAQRPIYRPPELDTTPDPYRIVGSQSDSVGTNFAEIRFASRAHLPMGEETRTGIAEIVYYVQEKGDDQRVLQRADHLYPYPLFEKQYTDPVLSENVKSLAFTYYNAEGSEAEAWDSESEEYDYSSPTAIGIRLELGEGEESYVFETKVLLNAHRGKSG